MIKLELKSIEKGIYLLQINLRIPILPRDLPKVKLPKAEGKGLVISGRAPIWFYCYILHHYLHLFQFIAVYDPKQEGAVVVASHHPDYKVGDILPITEGV